MLPAIEIDGVIVTESDEILHALEQLYGPLQYGMDDDAVFPLRQLERNLFSAWCRWLCYPATTSQEATNKQVFLRVVQQVEAALARSEGSYFLDEFSTADVVFTPYVERMAASLYYYKGYDLKDRVANPGLARWFEAM